MSTSTSQFPAAPRRASLRFRVVVSFAALAIVPFILSLSLLFLVARHDVGRLQGETLQLDSRLLAKQLQVQIQGAGDAVLRLASLPEIRIHLLQGGEQQSNATLEQARAFLPGLKRLAVLPAATLAPVGPATGAASWGTGNTLEYQVTVTGDDGETLGVLDASFDLSGFGRVFDWFQIGEQGRAVLYTAAGERLLGSPELPLPGPESSGAGWTRYETANGEFFAGITPVTLGNAGVATDWLLAVIQPASDAYAAFNFVARQVAVLLVAFGMAVLVLAWRTAGRFLAPIMQIRHGAEIISRINLGHRIEVETGDELEDLAGAFNEMAGSLAGAYDELEERVRDTTRHLQEERNRLAAVLRTMVDGVVLTNEAGEILLMNPRARISLDSGPSTGIGAPLSRLLPKGRLEFHLRRLRKHWEQGRESVEEVVFPLADGSLLRGAMAAVPGPAGERAGFLLVFRDLGGTVGGGDRPEETIRRLPEMLRGPLATARSLVEALERHPEMKPEKKSAFLVGVREELTRLTERLGIAEEAVTAAGSARWRGVPCDPRELLEAAAASVSGVFLTIEAPTTAPPPVLVEPYSLVAGVACVLRWLSSGSSAWLPIAARLDHEEGTVVTTLRVEGNFSREVEELEGLDATPAGESPLSLGDAVRKNGGEIWLKSAEDALEVRLGLMPAPTHAHHDPRTGIADEQPEFYDFDLFLPRLTQESSEWLSSPLESLEYVVFDTETTGLNPSKGDEIVSLSAVRVRRGKVQTTDTFHALVNPGFPIPKESIAFHGIEDHMVADQPRIGDVLPKFYEYAGQAVLVAHNAAFDKRFLDIAASRAGLPLMDNPILDTLFLSYGIHRDFEGHNLDAIAERLGITIEGRHTSLGDAKATAQILQRLISLLSSRGIGTLGEAKSFCDRMLLLRWQSSRF